MRVERAGLGECVSEFAVNGGLVVLSDTSCRDATRPHSLTD